MAREGSGDQGFYTPPPARYYHFSNGSLRRFNLVEGPSGWVTEIDSGGCTVALSDALLTVHYEPRERPAEQWLARIEDGRLEIGCHPKGGAATEINAKTAMVVRLVRSDRPPPPMVHIEKPAARDHPLFGWLACDEPRRLTGSIAVDGRIIELSFAVDEAGSPDDALQTGERVWLDLASWRERVESYAAEQLLTLKNDAWLATDPTTGEPEAPLVPARFRDWMQLASVAFLARGQVEFMYAAGDLFLGHFILVDCTLSQGPTSASLSG